MSTQARALAPTLFFEFSHQLKSFSFSGPLSIFVLSLCLRADSCSLASLLSLVIGDYAWNRTSEPLPDNVRRTVTWADVDAQLDSLLSDSSDSSASGGGGGSGSNGHKDREQGAPAAAPAAAASEVAAPAVTALPDGEKDATTATTAAAAAVAAAATGSRDNGDVRPARDRKVSQPAAPPSTSPPLGEDVVACSA